MKNQICIILACFAASVGSVDVATNQIPNNDAAQSICGPLCAARNMTFSGQWTNEDNQGLCGCTEKQPEKKAGCSLTNPCPNASPLGTEGIACCQNVCTPKKRDWAGVWYCPHECVGKIFGSAGSCN